MSFCNECTDSGNAQGGGGGCLTSRSVVLQRRKAEVRAVQPCGVKYYVGVIATVRLGLIIYSALVGQFAIQYLTYQVYVLATGFYLLLFLYLCGLRCLYFFVFHVLFPLVYGLTFAVFVLLSLLLYNNSFLVEKGLQEDNMTVGELYILDHILHTVPFVNILIMSFMFARYTLLTPHQLRKRERDGVYYDLSAMDTADQCNRNGGGGGTRDSLKRRRRLIERVASLSYCQRFLYALYVFHYWLSPCLYILLYMCAFEFEHIYGDVSFDEPIVNLMVVGSCLTANLTLALIGIYSVRLRHRQNNKARYLNAAKPYASKGKRLLSVSSSLHSTTNSHQQYLAMHSGYYQSASVAPSAELIAQHGTLATNPRAGIYQFTDSRYNQTRTTEPEDDLDTSTDETE